MIKNQISRNLSIAQSPSNSNSIALSLSNRFKFNNNPNSTNPLISTGEENLRLRWRTIMRWNRRWSGKITLIRRGLGQDRAFGLNRLYLRAWMMLFICVRILWLLLLRADQGLVQRKWVCARSKICWRRGTIKSIRNTNRCLLRCTRILIWSMKPLKGTETLDQRKWPQNNSRRRSKKFIGTSLGKYLMRSMSITT